MSEDPLRAAVARIRDALEGTTSAESRVYESLAHALRHDARTAIVVRATRDEPVLQESTHTHERHRLDVEVVGIARELEDRFRLSRDIVRVLAQLDGDRRSDEIGSSPIDFAEIGEVGGKVLDKPVFTSTHRVHTHYRVTYEEMTS